MSTTQITKTFTNASGKFDPTSVKLSDLAGAYGVKRLDTGAVVVADDTAMTQVATGVYSYIITDPAYDLTYRYALEFVIGGSPHYEEMDQVGTITPVGAFTAGTLGAVRKLVVDQSGRYDLVDDAENGDYSDNGCNGLINAAQDWLDDQLQLPKSEAWLYKSLASGESLVTFQQARVVRAVYIATTADGRTELTKKSLSWMKENYTDVPLSALDTGTPKWWAPAPLGLAPDQASEDASSMAAAGFTDIDFLAYGNHFPLRGLIVMPPSDATRTLMILADWYSATLTNDTDRSFWTVQHPQILADATRRQIEISLHRNTQGVKDFEEPLVRRVRDIYFSMTAENIAGPPSRFVMGG